jgi:hypothetical protein
MREKTILLKPIKLFLPVQSCSQKYFASRFPQNSGVLSPIPRPHEGRFAIVTDVGRGMRWTLWRFHDDERCKADGEVVWS